MVLGFLKSLSWVLFSFSSPWCNATSGLFYLVIVSNIVVALMFFPSKQSIKLLCNFSNYKAFPRSLLINPTQLWVWSLSPASHKLVSSNIFFCIGSSNVSVHFFFHFAVDFSLPLFWNLGSNSSLHSWSEKAWPRPHMALKTIVKCYLFMSFLIFQHKQVDSCFRSLFI